MTFFRGFAPDKLAQALAQTTPAAVHSALQALVRTGTRRLVNPRAAAFHVPSPYARWANSCPHESGEQTAGELLEVGLMSLLRDVPLQELNSHPLAIRGAETLAQFSGAMAAPGPDGLFRLNRQRLGVRIGRLVSAPIPLGWGSASFAVHRREGAYGNTQADWDAWQAGNVPRGQELIGHRSSPITGRDVASLCHQDPPFSIPLMVAWQLLGAKAPLSSRFPALANEDPFVSGGGRVELECSIAALCYPAMLDAWQQKWVRLRRPRPDQLWRSGALHQKFRDVGGWIVEAVGPYLSSCYAEGAPIHSDYPSGHAVLAGVGFTILKAWFADGPVPSLGITNLHAELDLMASHMSYGRIWAGIHTRSSVLAGLLVGQAHAVAHLQALAAARPVELVNPTTFIGFNGQPLTV